MGVSRLSRGGGSASLGGRREAGAGARGADLDGEGLAGQTGRDAGDAGRDARGRVAREGHSEVRHAVHVPQHRGKARAGGLGESRVEEGVVGKLLGRVGAEEGGIAGVVDAVMRADCREEALSVPLQVREQLRRPRHDSARRSDGIGVSGATPGRGTRGAVRRGRIAAPPFYVERTSPSSGGGGTRTARQGSGSRVWSSGAAFSSA